MFNISDKIFLPQGMSYFQHLDRKKKRNLKRRSREKTSVVLKVISGKISHNHNRYLSHFDF